MGEAAKLIPSPVSSCGPQPCLRLYESYSGDGISLGFLGLQGGCWTGKDVQKKICGSCFKSFLILLAIGSQPWWYWRLPFILIYTWFSYEKIVVFHSSISLPDGSQTGKVHSQVDVPAFSGVRNSSTAIPTATKVRNLSDLHTVLARVIPVMYVLKPIKMVSVFHPVDS